MTTEQKTELPKEETARQRLRAQKKAHEQALREAGLEAGHAFVLDIEEDDDVYAQMKRLARHDEYHDRPEDLAGLIAAMDATDTGLEVWFCENYQRGAEEPAWLSGFVSGALQKFQELAP
jgi:hypothetical protein